MAAPVLFPRDGNPAARLAGYLRRMIATAGEVNAAARARTEETRGLVGSADDALAALAPIERDLAGIRAYFAAVGADHDRLDGAARAVRDGVGHVRMQMDGIGRAEAELRALLGDAAAQAGGASRVARMAKSLATNAAIEAARQGAVGRGFATIAGEMQTLVDESSRRAAEIGRVMDDLATRLGALRASAAAVDAPLAGLDAAARDLDDVLEAAGRATEAKSADAATLAAAIGAQVARIRDFVAMLGRMQAASEMSEKGSAANRHVGAEALAVAEAMAGEAGGGRRAAPLSQRAQTF